MRWFISIRYFLTHKRQSLVCIAGVTIAVMMFITMTSLMNGLTDKFIVETVESSGHITIKDEPRETRTLILAQATAVWLDADLDILVDRVRRRDSRPLLKGRDPREVLADLARVRNPLYAQAHIRVLSNRAPHDVTVAAILKAIGR